MKIIRYLDWDKNESYATQLDDGKKYHIEGDILGDFEVTDQEVNVDKLLAPVKPSQIICIGLNYKEHARESNLDPPQLPVVFVKGINSVQNPEDPILLPTYQKSDEVDYECELAVVIGKTCKNVKKDEALDYVLGYTCANDVSARDWQLKKGGGQWCKGKFFDTFAPLGPWIVTPDEIPNPNKLSIKTILNGDVMQDSNTGDMIFDVKTLIEFLSGSTTLLAGTVILTGTPQGVGMSKDPPRWLQPGDEVVVEIEGIGRLVNPVESESS